MSSFYVEVIDAPVAKARPRVTVQNGKARAYTPAKTKQSEWAIKQSFLATYADAAPLEGPLELSVLVILPMPKSIPKKRQATAKPTARPDVDNYLKTVLDALNTLAWKDDAQVTSAVIIKNYGEPPRWMISVHARP